MKCPACSNRHLAVEVLFRGMVPCTFGEGDEVQLADETCFSSEWNDTSRCECLICGWEGTMDQADLDRSGADGESTRRERNCGGGECDSSRTDQHATAVLELDAIRELLRTAPCNPLWDGHVRRLIGEVQRLRDIIDVVSRISDCERRSGTDNSEQDTIVG